MVEPKFDASPVRWRTAGVVELCSSGKSLKIVLSNPERIFYVGLSDLDSVLKRRKSSASFVEKEREKPELHL